MITIKMDVATLKDWRVTEVQLPPRPGCDVLDVIFQRRHPNGRTGTMEMAWGALRVKEMRLETVIDVGYRSDEMALYVSYALLQHLELRPELHEYSTALGTLMSALS